MIQTVVADAISSRISILMVINTCTFLGTDVMEGLV
jgi:hypothetical protein